MENFYISLYNNKAPIKQMLLKIFFWSSIFSISTSSEINNTVSEIEITSTDNSFLTSTLSTVKETSKDNPKTEKHLTWTSVKTMETMPFGVDIKKTIPNWKLVPGVEFQMEVNISSILDRFYIDLEEQDGDIPLNVNPRFFNTHGEAAGEFESIVLGTRKNGRWMVPSASLIYPFPFPIKQDVPFQLGIICETGQFRIVINGDTVGVYGYRLKVENITKFVVTGRGLVSFVKVGVPNL